MKYLYSPYPQINFNFSNSELEGELQKAVDVDKKLFQLIFSLNGVSTDGISDLYKSNISDIVLHIEYEIPG